MIIMPEGENQLFLLLGRLEGKVDTLLSKYDSVEVRVNDLEKKVEEYMAILNKGRGVFSTLHAIYITLAGVLGAVTTKLSTLVFPL